MAVGIEAEKIAEGVHVGQSDMPYEIDRKLMGPEAIIGLSVETWEDVERAEGLDCDYLGVSPVLPRRSRRTPRNPEAGTGLIMELVEIIMDNAKVF